ncbi:MAG: HAD-IC family P-type ATPase [Clostridia bacterium]|nr:HAD-IC family P-type ATPase [Clostridia bacterium]
MELNPNHHPLPEGYTHTPDGGLSAAEAQKRKEQGLSGKVTADPGKSIWQILAGNLFTLFNLLNFFLAACLIAVGSYRNLLFMGVVISNTLIGTVQEIRAKRAIDRMELMNAPQVHILRDGQETECRMEDTVQGDLNILRAGDQITADGLVRSGSGTVCESMLTGESDDIGKQQGDWLMSGSYVTSGKLVCEMINVGDASYAAGLSHAAKKISRPKSALMTDLNKLVRFISMILVPLGLLLLFKQLYIQQVDVPTAVTAGVASMLGMIPEGLILLTSMALAVGVIRLSRRNTLVQELYGIETLARADVLCLDKTGTITTGKMQLERVHPLHGTEEEVRQKLRRFMAGFDGHSGTLDAIRQGVGTDETAQVLSTKPFSSKTKSSAVLFADGTELTLGAAEFLFPEGVPADIRKAIDDGAGEGLRVLALVETVQDKRTPVGLVFLRDELRSGAGETMDYFRKQGVAVKIISGDDARTVSVIAGQVGVEGWQNAVDASTLKDEAALAEAAVRYTVFGRVTPEQKRALVEAMKKAGHSVAMTGDGVNDIPALKAADCSIAMAGGSDAARHAAQITLLDADFTVMPEIVGEGRRVVGNITRAASLFLVKTLYSFALSVLTLLLPLQYPFQPIQLTLISALTIGAPSFILAMEPNRERIKGRFLQNILLRAVPGAAAVTVCAVGAMMLTYYGFAYAECSTAAAIAAGIVGLVMLGTVCTPFNALRTAVLVAMSIGFIGALVLFGHVFYIHFWQLPSAIWMPMAGVLVLALAVMLLATKAMKAIICRMEQKKTA